MKATNPTQLDVVKSDCVDLTQADLDRGLTPEQIARERADLNWDGFMRDMKQVFKDGVLKADRKQAKHE